MSEKPEEQDSSEELEAQEGVLLPPREAMSLINPAPGDMPVDPPIEAPAQPFEDAPL